MAKLPVTELDELQRRILPACRQLRFIRRRFYNDMINERSERYRTRAQMSSDGKSFTHRPWKILSSRYVIETPHLRLRADSVELPDGTVVNEYFVQESRGYSVILPITTGGDVVLVRQYKHGIGKVILELPAGGIDPGEDSATCAARELAEETGYIGEAPEFIGAFNTNPTGSSGRFHLYIIRNAELKVAQDLDSTEDIEVVTVDFATLQRYVRDGTIDTNTHISAVLFIFDLVAQGKITLAPGSLPPA